MKRRYLPSLRGFFGDWTYYSCAMPLRELAKRVSFADDIRKSEKLSDMIQRELKKSRTSDISNYLTDQPERFFNSLVVAVYRGDPAWHEFGNITPRAGVEIKEEDLPDETRHSVGFLSFNGNEKLFAVDGQHRLAGMKKVLLEQDEDSDVLHDQVPVIFVAHKGSKEGIERTRRLFTTLNKNAKPVSKGETIALDEDDVMAICVRRLVEENKCFMNERISFKSTNNLSANDFTSLTTIGNLYDLLGILFSRIMKGVRLKELQFNRPPESELDEYYTFACEYFEQLAATFSSLRKFFRAKRFGGVVKKYRGDFGGSIFFRPIGLKLMTEVIAELCSSDDYSLDSAITKCASLPENLDALPYEGLIWDSTRSNMSTPLRVPLTRDLLLYMLGERADSPKLRNRYAAALGKPGSGATLLNALSEL